MGALLFEWLKQLPTVAVGGLAVYFAYKLITVTQKQVDVAQREVDISQQARFDQRRPILVPCMKSVPDDQTFVLHVESLHGANDPDRWYVDLNSKYDAWLHNIGEGPALNVRGTIFPPKSRPPFGDSPQHQFFKFSKPILPGEIDKEISELSGIPSNGNATIGREPSYTLNAPQAPLPNDPASLQTYPLVRLVVTYRDIFGRKHASVFHFTSKQEWAEAEEPFLSGIPRDLDDLIREEAEHPRPVYTPPTPVQLPSESS